MGRVVGSILGVRYFLLYCSLSIPIFSFLYMLNSLHLNQLRMSLTINPVVTILLGIGFLSLAGLPPFLGFFGKWLVLTYLVDHFLLGVAIVLVVGTLISLFYYLRISYLCIIVLGPQQIIVGLS